MKRLLQLILIYILIICPLISPNIILWFCFCALVEQNYTAGIILGAIAVVLYGEMIWILLAVDNYLYAKRTGDYNEIFNIFRINILRK